MKSIFTTSICLIFILGSFQLLATERITTSESMLNDTIVLGLSTVTGTYCNEDIGSLTFIVLEGASCDLEYTIQPAAQDFYPWQDSPYFGNLPVNDYVMFARVKTDTTIFDITTAQIPDFPEPEVDDISMTCMADANVAEVEINISGGFAGFTISSLDPDGETEVFSAPYHQISFLIDEPKMGVYQFSIEDFNGCVLETSINFTGDCFTTEEIVLATPLITGEYCGTCNGTITINLSGGLSQDVEYSIDGGISWQNSNYFIQLCAADYLIVARNKLALENFAITSAQIFKGDELKISQITSAITPQDETTVNLEITGGTPAYNLCYVNPLGEKYSVESNTNTYNFAITNFTEGYYQFVILDELQCEIDTSIFIQDMTSTPEQIVMGDPILTHATCDNCNGTLTFNILEGLSMDVEYSIDMGVTWQNSPLFEGLCIADFIIIARDRNDYDNEAIGTAQIASAPDLEITDFSYACDTVLNSAACIIEVADGTPEYNLNYTTPNGDMHSITGLDTLEFTIDEFMAGEYFFSVEDRLGCIKDTIISITEDCIQGTTGTQDQIPSNWQISFTQEPGSIHVWYSSIAQSEKINLSIYSTVGNLNYFSDMPNLTAWNEKINLPLGTYFFILESETGYREVYRQVVF